MSTGGEFDYADDIAVVGMAGRFPGARSVEEFWRNLRDGVESISFFTEDELEAVGDAAVGGGQVVRAGGVLADAEMFDAAFFGVSPREAEITDPQQRLFLECAWEALEHAGYDPERFEGRVGVYASASMNTYLYNLYSNPELLRAAGAFLVGIGNDKDYIATRVSYKLNLKGPSVTVQTSCSSSLVAVHLACQSLLDGQCDMVLAGGVSVKFPQKVGYVYQEGGIHSPDGHCRAFDERARGFVGGNGVGVVALRRLEDALADGDTVHAVIKGSAINNDGSLKVGFTAPSMEGQAEVIADALAMARVPPESVTYVEAHGTGTALGDPIEVAALAHAFRASSPSPLPQQSCGLGSVKTNIGHLDAAAGIASLIKAVLALKHRQLPPSLHFTAPNPSIDFSQTPFYVNARLRDWESNGSPRRAGVSSFGIGGTNAHVILEEAPAEARAPAVRASTGGEAGREAGAGAVPEVLCVSGRSREGLRRACGRLAEWLVGDGAGERLGDVAYTLREGRRAWGWRRAVVARGAEEAAWELEREAGGAREAGRGAKVWWLFPGQGAQYAGMGRGLYERGGAYRAAVDACAARLGGVEGAELLKRLGGGAVSDGQEVMRTREAQLSLFVTEYALAEQLREWGVSASGVLGHSLGEYVAACVAGVFSLEDALEIVAARGRLMDELETGGMLAVPLGEERVRELLGSELALAAVNGPELCVVSGQHDAVGELEARLREQGVEGRRLHTSHAFHSAMMEPAVEKFVTVLKRFKLNEPNVPYVSNLTGTWAREEVTDPAYWGRHLRQTVRFGDGLKEFLRERGSVFLEVGPGQTLGGLVKRQPDYGEEHLVVSTMRHPHEQASDMTHLLKAAARLWEAGVEVDWRKVCGGKRGRRVPLPTYPFEREHYWVAPTPRAAEAPVASKRKELSEWFYVPAWKESVAPKPAAGGARHCWLLFTDKCGLGASLAERLTEAGHDVLTVAAAKGFERRGEQSYAVGPSSREDYARLLDELRARGKSPAEVVHLWNVTRADEAAPTVERLEDSLGESFYSLLFLAQALGAEGAETRRVCVVSNDMQEVTGEEATRPEKALALGTCRVLPREYTSLRCRSLDVSLPAQATRQFERLVGQLVAELEGESSEPVVAFRGARRWMRGFESLRLEGAEQTPPPLREQGVYLITGGRGLEMAEYLAGAVRARVALVSAVALPDRSEWARWSGRGGVDDEVSRLVRCAEAVERLGGELLTFEADVSERAEAARLIADVRERFGALHGLIHAAADDDAPVRAQTALGAFDALGARLRGPLVLGELSEGAGLDFILFCSPLAAAFGAAGSVFDSAADAFLSALARRRFSRQETPTVVLKWEPWRDRRAARDEAGAAAVSREQTQEALRRALRAGVPEVLVSALDPEALAARAGATHAAAESAPESPHADETAKSLHRRPQLETPYVEPRNEVERVLAGLWQEALGIEQVGVEDNFFALGGDSVVSLKIIAQANQAGLQLSAKQIFENQTIAALAAAAGTGAQAVAAEQGAVTGEVPLTPIQHWFFEQEFVEPQHFNQAVMLGLKREPDVTLLRRAFERLPEQHDALRLRFVRTGSGWRQFNGGVGETPIVFVERDFSHLNEEEQRRAVESAADELQSGFDLSAGGLLRAALFNLGARGRRLLLVAHHLVTDAVSWRVLAEDLANAYQQLARGEAIRLPPKTTSFKRWAERLTEHARSAEITEELDYWLSESLRGGVRLPSDYPGGANTVASAQTVTAALDAENTRALLQDVAAAFRTQINDVLLTALARALRTWAGDGSLLINLEGHGREDIFADVDLSRTVGWFTTTFPVALTLDGSEAVDTLKAVKERLRRVPRRGFGYGLLRYLGGAGEGADSLRAQPAPEVNFLYLGQLDQALPESSLFTLATEPTGRAVGSRELRRHLLEVGAYIIGGELQLSWTYSENLHRRSTVEWLAAEFVAALRALVEQSRAPSAWAYTPSDFPEASLDQTELDELIAMLGDAEE